MKNHFTFFAALAAITLAFAGGIIYFKNDADQNNSSLLADIGSVAPGNNQSSTDQTIAVETIPTSTIVVASTSTATSSSSTSTSKSPSAPPVPLITPLTLPYSFKASTLNLTYWPKAWGGIAFTKDSLDLIPDAGYHGANGFLGGSTAWTNYSISAIVSPLAGGWFDIVARVANNTQNFVYCEFGPNGTEAIERIDGVDTQLEHTTASTTAIEGESENFGMQVYGNNFGCAMDGQEVLGASVTNGGESPKGGIGFVIFGAPPTQQQVAISGVSVSALSRDTIIFPFPVPVPVVVVPPTPTTTPASVATPTSTGTPAKPPSPEPAPTPATTTKTLPYVANTFYTGDGWGQYWGTFSEATNGLTIGANSSIPSGGALLDGTAQLDNYTFGATFDWLEGEEVGLFARHTDNNNYVECKLDRIDSADVRMSLVQDVRGNYMTLNQTVLPNYTHVDGVTFAAYVEVQDTAATCGFDGHVLSNAGTGLTINPPYSGEVGLTTYDPGTNNSLIRVSSASIKENY